MLVRLVSLLCFWQSHAPNGACTSSGDGLLEQQFSFMPKSVKQRVERFLKDQNTFSHIKAAAGNEGVVKDMVDKNV